MGDHAIFGGCLRSDISLPELPSIECGSPDWTFRRATASAAPVGFLAEERVDELIRVRCGLLPDGFRLDFDDTGVFDVTQRGCDIAWTPGGASLELVRADLLGGVLSLALHMQGLFCLHGSAVGIGDDAVGFLANKGGGKSTLAAALCASGCTLITDDMLPVDPESVSAWPAMSEVRLLGDSAAELGMAVGARHPTSSKYHVTALPSQLVERRRLPVAAFYELTPTTEEPGQPAAQRTRLSGSAAVSMLLRHNRVPASVRALDVRGTFLRAAQIARTVPVFRLRAVRRLSRLQEVVDQLRRWHGSPRPDEG